MTVITAVWSSYGHRFCDSEPIEESNSSYEKCLTCGGQWILSPAPEDDPLGFGEGYGKYHASNGDDPIECTGRTDLEHHYEAVCQAANGRGCEASEDGPCEHLAAEQGCNCVLCA